MQPHRMCYQGSSVVLPETEKLVKRVIYLPTGMAIEPDDVAKVCEIICFVLRNSTDVKGRLDQGRDHRTTNHTGF
jgi:dTDP-4-amino-4,6-dideoxygalactose transaminase